MHRDHLAGVSCGLILLVPSWALSIGHVASRRSPPSWQSVGSDDSAAYWFSEFQGTLHTIQDTYWNGSTWPDAIQWIGAFLDTLLAASDRSLVSALEHDPSLFNAQYTAAETFNNITTYFSQIEAYYPAEDTDQIFDAAYDDAQWVVLEWLEALKFIGQYDAYAQTTHGQEDIASFAHRAHIFYNIVQNQFDTSLCGGGISWNPALAPYKNAITNELFLASSIAMYLYFPGDNNTDPYPSPSYLNQTNTTLPPLPSLQVHDPLLLQNAVDEYTWFTTSNFTNAQGLIVDGFHISDNQTTCDQRNEMVYTYNQGVILSGLRGLWEATGNTTYLSDGYSLIDTVINATGWNAKSADEAAEWAGLGRNGIMEDYCDAPANCSQDNQIFKGIYFTHLDAFCERLPTKTPLVEGVTVVASEALAAEHREKCAGYAPWVKHNAYAALSTRNDSGIIGGWWGADFANRSQTASSSYARKPRGSYDEWNEPGVLSEAPWVCHGQHGCHTSGHRGQRGGKRGARNWRLKRDVNDDGLGRTVETQGSGLGVVRAASDFARRFV